MPERRLIFLLITLGLLATGLVTGLAFALPYKSEIKQTLKTPAYLNLPCQQAMVENSETGNSTLKLTATGTGLGGLSFTTENDEIRLLKNGLFFGLECTLHIRLKKGEIIYLPAPMPFVARGVVPTRADNIRQRSGINWRQIEGFR